ncbi:MAG TPA: ImmA/IrrE family metallo-endopeptidase [Candidatus Sulfotelmatobacter sp.]|nr:ImmA/IrrE family metallo-endopeptidase [Candidatus Sulfotelmatobacter sp.]
MNKKLKYIYYSFDGKLVGNKKMKISVLETLSKMPEEIIEYITKNCWFFASMEDAYGYTFNGNDLKNQHLIFLSDELLFQSNEQIQYTIAHEIGHVILRHRNSVLERQSKEEIRKQEREADIFAKKFSYE